jgi:hypothetical protein
MKQRSIIVFARNAGLRFVWRKMKRLRQLQNQSQLQAFLQF